MTEVNPHFWGIVLAGGEGKRLQEFVRNQYNSESPKQYCAFIGTRSMLTHTIDRAERLIPPERLLTIVNRQHLQYTHTQLNDRPPRTVIIQPDSRDTAPGILYPLFHIQYRDPEAVVAIFPSDHFVPDETQFLECVQGATSFVHSHPESIVLLGVEPHKPEGEYGWIETGEKLFDEGGRDIYRVSRFVEKPDTLTARLLYQRRSLWNTMVLVSHAHVLLNLFKVLTPTIYNAFTRIKSVFNSPWEQEIIEDVYKTLPSVNFSQAVLSKNPRGLTVLRMNDMYWSDWGNPERILLDLRRLTSQHVVNHAFAQKQLA